MRIAFLTRADRELSLTTLTDEPLGGTQSSLLHLARELAQRQYEVHIFCTTSQLREEQGITFQPFAQLPRFARKNPLEFLIIVADDLAASLKIPAKQTLLWLHNDYPHLWNELPDLRSEFSATLATKCDRVIAVSQWQAQKLKDLCELPPEHIQVMPNGIYAPYFETEPSPASPPRLLYSAVPGRGLPALLQIFPRIQAHIPEVELHLYSSYQVWGVSPEKDQAAAGTLYQQAQQMQGVFLHPLLAVPQLSQKLAEGSLWVYPQHRSQPLPQSPMIWEEAESFCLAALEAQAAGLPVIASARGALSERVSNGQTGFLIAGDAFSDTYQEAFAEACLRLLQDPQQRQEMGLRARQNALADYRWEQIADQWEALFQQFESTRLLAPRWQSTFVNPQISVIIPTYNRARNLKNCLESLTWQDFKAFEVIICDDGSSDQTQAVAESFQTRLNLRYRWQPDEGFRAAEARNMGLKLARGKALTFLDSDLVVPPCFLSRHLEGLKSQPKIVVNSYVARQLEPDDTDLGLPPAEYIPKHTNNLKIDRRDRFELFDREPVAETYFLDSNAFSIWREDLNFIGGFDANFVGWGLEDTELGYRIAGHNMKLLLIKTGVESYHQIHYVSEDKDAQCDTNWKRLTQKYSIDEWYNPLWELKIEAPVQLHISGDLPEFLDPFMDARCVLKRGRSVPAIQVQYALFVEDGILKSIVPYGQEEQAK